MTTHTVNAHGVDPATVTQAHADRVAAALGLAGADRIGCGGFLMGCRTGWLTLTIKPFHPEHPNIVAVPWSLVAGLGEPDWRPIDTAPLSKGLALPEYVLVSHVENAYVFVGYRHEPNYPGDPEWCDEHGSFIEPQPTHWMPRPAPAAIRDSRTPNEAGHG